MASHELTQTQKNLILGEIRRVELDPADFLWRSVGSTVTVSGVGRKAYTVEQLVHRPTGYTFKFDVEASRGSLWAIFCPGPEGAARREHAGTWEHVWRYFQGWLETVAREHHAPDLWAEFGRERELVRPPRDEEENTAFTEDERALIGMQLRELAELLKRSYELDGGQVRELEARLRYLEEASGRVGRLDWRQILIAELIGLALRAIIPEGAFQEAAHFLARGISHLFGDGIAELPCAPTPPV